MFSHLSTAKYPNCRFPSSSPSFFSFTPLFFEVDNWFSVSSVEFVFFYIGWSTSSRELQKPMSKLLPHVQSRKVLKRLKIWNQSPRKTSFVLSNYYKPHPMYQIICEVLGLHLWLKYMKPIIKQTIETFKDTSDIFQYQRPWTLASRLW